MTGLVADAARAAAVILAADLGPGLPAEVEADLHYRGAGEQRPGQFDPLAIAGNRPGAGAKVLVRRSARNPANS